MNVEQMIRRTVDNDDGWCEGGNRGEIDLDGDNGGR
ncbi:hypothetical protein KS4_36810 [Poriferisphaera corsica]|uniref:Uncharacterized protein n=1 Tax=Poriferisphaera corsica TaxID=2528020 RepID=A0A517YZD0_9BACT|nr:hypothetical protein KS4_36810 [Poriferisphaera corsica]